MRRKTMLRLLCICIGSAVPTWSLFAAQSRPSVAFLGASYFSDTDSFNATCLDLEKIRKGPGATQSDTQLNLKRVRSLREVYASLSAAFTARGGVPLLTAASTTEFFAELEFHNASDSFVGEAITYTGSEVIMDLAFKREVDKLPKPKFEEICGTKYVRTLHNGGQLLVSVTLTFSNHRERARFWSNSTANIASLGSLKGRIALNAQALTEDAALHIRVIQKGGDPAQLGAIFPPGALDCSLKNPDACSKLIDAVVMYVGNFSKQVRASPSAVDFETAPYPRHGFPDTDGPCPAVRIALYEEYFRSVASQRTGEKLIRSVVGDPEKRIRRAMMAATKNRDILSAALEQSRTGPCPPAPKALPGYTEFDDADLNPPLPRGNFVSLNRNGAQTVFWADGVDGYCGYRDDLHLHSASPVSVTPDAPVILDTSWWHVAIPINKGLCPIRAGVYFGHRVTDGKTQWKQSSYSYGDGSYCGFATHDHLEAYKKLRAGENWDLTGWTVDVLGSFMHQKCVCEADPSCPKP
jgi:hypothetical protein